jgi:hypothetical protein
MLPPSSGSPDLPPLMALSSSIASSKVSQIGYGRSSYSVQLRHKLQSDVIHCTLVLCPFLAVVRSAMRLAPAIRPARNPAWNPRP